MERIEELIQNAIQNELRYNTDNITSEGWDFLENESHSLVLEKINEMDMTEEELSELQEIDIANFLSDVILEYEQTHSNIRYYE